jgi:hypothetical protein
MTVKLVNYCLKRGTRIDIFLHQQNKVFFLLEIVHISANSPEDPIPFACVVDDRSTWCIMSRGPWKLNFHVSGSSSLSGLVQHWIELLDRQAAREWEIL